MDRKDFEKNIKNCSEMVIQIPGEVEIKLNSKDLAPVLETLKNYEAVIKYVTERLTMYNLIVSDKDQWTRGMNKERYNIHWDLVDILNCETRECLICDKRDILITSRIDETGDKIYRVECMECGCHTPEFLVEEEAVRFWNVGKGLIGGEGYVN